MRMRSYTRVSHESSSALSALSASGSGSAVAFDTAPSSAHASTGMPVYADTSAA
eukprot:CAMPEP_0170155082 /NCGR_PEP_ID=MMETSP0033_2-20121228/59712_1 /TAXON_ID=195969 /ORGANISM="Dolichomastix tenuilepis, Strain CCMP3274" /LENGTH=53 /DNA_ID=CAMNT_0010392379 /DNA_START=116 /DNA_END=277 /DNA_ORIENTATION=-